jgi:hypothetical protein
MKLSRALTAIALTMTFSAGASAQVTPAGGYVPPDDTPSVKVGVTLYTDFTYQQNPKTIDSDLNTINPSAFNVSRSYINITGNLNHIVSFRITPDVTRETFVGPSVSGSLVFRLKYAYAQFNLDDWMTRGSWARFGIQQTPWVDFEEGIYRYRFEGTVFAERVPLPTTMTSSDAGASYHWNFPSNYGDIHVGVYNGENYQRVETNNQKALEFRGTVRPFALGMPILRGIRAHLVYYNDHYQRHDERKRLMGNVTYEAKYLNAGFDYLSAEDQTLATNPEISSHGYSVWATPRLPYDNGSSWEALLRYDHWIPNTSSSLVPAASSPQPGTTVFNQQIQNRTIAGVSYWFPHQGSVSTAILFDYDGQSFKNITTAPVRTVSVNGLVNF